MVAVCCSGSGGVQAAGVEGGLSAALDVVRAELKGPVAWSGVCCWRAPSSSFGVGVWFCLWQLPPLSLVGVEGLVGFLRNHRPAVFDQAACSMSRLVEVRERDELVSSCWSGGGM